jgi:hypothetical protein
MAVCAGEPPQDGRLYHGRIGSGIAEEVMKRDRSLEPPFRDPVTPMPLWRVILIFVTICAGIGMGGAVIVAEWSDLMSWSIND